MRAFLVVVAQTNVCFQALCPITGGGCESSTVAVERFRCGAKASQLSLLPSARVRADLDANGGRIVARVVTERLMTHNERKVGDDTSEGHNDSGRRPRMRVRGEDRLCANASNHN